MGIGLMRVQIELAVLAALADEVIEVLTVVFFSTPLQRHSWSYTSITACCSQPCKTRQ
jgi:hypothetical protein